MKKSTRNLLLTLAAAAMMAGCSDNTNTATTTTTTTTTTQTSPVPTATTYTQVERLARPAVNEGLILSNSLLNLWNSVSPDIDATSAAQPIVGEAGAVLQALGNGPLSDPNSRTNVLLKAFTPDVMRIDTSRASGYGTHVNALGAPDTGRLIKDDVIDVTLSVLVAPAVASANPGLTKDNVAYDTADATGRKHQPLLSTFPYLAKPN